MFTGRLGGGPTKHTFILLINLYSALNPSISLIFAILLCQFL